LPDYDFCRIAGFKIAVCETKMFRKEKKLKNPENLGMR